MEVTIFPCLCQ